MGKIAREVEKLEGLIGRLIQTYRLELENEIKNTLNSKNVIVSCLQTSGEIIGLENLTREENFLCIKYGDAEVGTIFPFWREAYLLHGLEDTLNPLKELFKNKGYAVSYNKNASSPKNLINEIRKFCLGSPPMRDF